MKICQITYSGFGGLGSVVFSLIHADKEKKHHWSLAFFGDLEIDESYALRCQQVRVDYRNFLSKTGKPFKAWWELFTWLNSTKPDVILCHSITTIPVCWFYGIARRKKVIAIEHTPNQVKTTREKLASRLAMLLADSIVVLTSEYLEELRQLYGGLFQSNKVHLIANGIDTDEFYPSEGTQNESKKTIKIGMAARFSFSKRQDILIDAIAELIKLNESFKYELYLAGDGDQFQQCKELALSYGLLDKNVFFDGLLNETEVASWLRKIDIYAHPTEGETLSTSLLQAMATGLPIVSSNIPGVKNLLTSEEVYGVLVENQVSEYVDAIVSFRDNPKEARSLAIAARDRVLEYYSSQEMLNKYLKAIES